MKTCSSCKQSLPHNFFNKDSKRKDGLQNNCRECNKVYYKNYYATSPKEKERILANNKVRREEIDAFVRGVKDVPCIDCGIKYPYYVMQFDHLRDKEFNISTAKNWHSLNKIKKEVLKCEVVCANCHAVRTWGRAQGR